MQILYFILFGLVIGIIARFLMPGPQPMGMITTILLGIAGSFVGGAATNLMQGISITEPRAAGWIGSTLGAILLLVIGHLMRRRTVA